MARKGMEFPISVDESNALQGLSKVERGLHDVEDAAEDLGKAGKGIGDDVSKGTKEADEGIDKLVRSAQDGADKIKAEFKGAGKAVGDDVRRGTKDAESGMEEFKDEAKSTARESAASFTDVTSALDAVQEIAANALSGFGPAGAAAGIAAAIGIGVAVGKLQEAADAANALTEEAAAFALEMRDATDQSDRVAILRDRWDEVSTKIADARSIWEIWQPRAITNIERFSEAAKTGGLDIESMFNAFNDPNPVRRLEKLQRQLDATTDAQKDAQEAIEAYARVRGDKYDAAHAQALQHKRDVLKDSTKAMKEEIAASEATATITEALAKAEGLTVEAYLEKAAAVDAGTDAVKTNTEALEESTTALQENLDKQNASADAARGLFDAETNVAASIDAATKAMKDHKKDGLDPSTEGGRINRAAISDVAAAYDAQAEAVKNSGGSQAEANKIIKEGRDEVVGMATDLEYTTEEANAYADSLGLIPPKVDTKLQLEQDRAGYADARAKYDGLGRPISTTATVTAVLNRDEFDRQVRKLQNGVYQVSVNGKLVGMKYE